MYLKRKYGEGYNLIIESAFNENQQETVIIIFNSCFFFIIDFFFLQLFRIKQMIYSIQ